MKNYKIIENRPELTPEQIAHGMNFAVIKSNVLSPEKTLAKTAATKSVIIKVLVVAGLLTSSVLVYKNYNRANSGENKVTSNETIDNREYMVHDNESIRMATSKYLQFTASTVTKLPSQAAPLTEPKVTFVSGTQLTEGASKEVKPAAAVTKSNKTDTLVNSESINLVYKLTEPFKESPNAKCVLLSADALDNWVTAAPPITMNCTRCQFDYVTMGELEQNPNIKIVWLTVTVTGKSKFNLESHFKNIGLLKKANGITIQPVAIAIGAPSGNSNEGRVISDKFKADDLKVIFSKQVDIFMFFDGVKSGDRLIFDDFVLAEVKE